MLRVEGKCPGPACTEGGINRAGYSSPGGVQWFCHFLDCVTQLFTLSTSVSSSGTWININPRVVLEIKENVGKVFDVVVALSK